jgi:hypothetical protein
MEILSYHGKTPSDLRQSASSRRSGALVKTRSLLNLSSRIAGIRDQPKLPLTRLDATVLTPDSEVCQILF